MMLFFVFWMSCFVGVQAFWKGGSFGKSEGQCDGFFFDLNCPASGDVIEILTARYGKPKKGQCGSYGAVNEEKCELSNAKDIVMKRCNNQTACAFHINRDIFPDPCPGTSKYLDVTYKCVKFMFKCPGLLTGVGDEKEYSVNALPQNGSWTKDPLSDINHVYFASTGRVLQEYSTVRDFINGNPLKTYDALPYPISHGNIWVYDKNLYYIKENSRHIVRYSLITRKRTREHRIPAEDGFVGNNKITLHIDEKGFWVDYANKEGRIVISKLNIENLEPEKTWTTNLQQTESLHTFMICGILYSVNSRSGHIDYSFDTNQLRNQESFRLKIPFDQRRLSPFSTSRYQGKRSFLRYNSSILSYNPRDKLLYQWDATEAKAVTYSLHFPASKPIETTTRRYSTRTSTSRPRAKTPSIPPISSNSEPITSCAPVRRKGVLWPETNYGEVARLLCFDGTGGYATWKCNKRNPRSSPEWDEQGPDMTTCIDWINEIATQYDTGKADLTFSLMSTADGVSRKFDQISGRWIKVISELLKNWLANPTVPGKGSAKNIVKSIMSTVSTLMERTSAWESLDAETQAKVANNLITSIEKAGFLYIDAITKTPTRSKDKDVFRFASDNILLQTEVRRQWSNFMMFERETTFPDDIYCKITNARNCGSDIVHVPDSKIMAQDNGNFPGVMFTLYEKFGKYLSPNTKIGYQLDSSIISAALRHPRSSRRNDRDRRLRIILRHKTNSSNPRRCVKWNFFQSTGVGNWTEDGCYLTESNVTHSMCECDNLGRFALIVDKTASEGLSSSYEESLEIVTSAGISIAIIFLLMCIATLLVFKDLEGDHYTILKNMCVCTLIAEVIFLVGINQTSNSIGCAIVAALLQYFLLAVFVWMALEVIQLHRKFSEDFEPESRRIWLYLIGYGAPAAVVAFSIGFGYSDYGTSTSCFINANSAIILVPMISTLAAIVAVVGGLCIIIYRIYAISPYEYGLRITDKIPSIRNSVKKSFTILFFQLMTWILAISWINERTIVLACLFCLFNSTLGILMFVFHCVSPKKVRKDYKKLLDRVGCCQKIPKDSYLENSSTFQRQYAPRRFTPDNDMGIMPLSPSGTEYPPWDIPSPKTVISSPMDNNLRNTIYRTGGPGNRLQSNGTQHRYTMNPLDDPNNDPQGSLLPPTYDPRLRSGDVIPDLSNEIPHNHFHHHRHSDYFRREQSFEIDPSVHHQRYKTGIPVASRRSIQPKSNTMAQRCPIRTNPHYGHMSQSRPLLRDILSSQPRHFSIHENVNPVHQDAEPQFLPPPRQESRDFGYGDSGVPRLPPNSIIQRLRDEMLPANEVTSNQFHPVKDCSNSVIGDLSRPMQIQDFTSSLKSRRKLMSHNKKEINISEDEGQGSSVEECEHNTQCSRSDIAASRCAKHEETSISPSQTKTEIPKPGYQRKRPSIESDPDDPIVTDCSGGSNDSSFARQRYKWSNQEMLV